MTVIKCNYNRSASKTHHPATSTTSKVDVMHGRDQIHTKLWVETLKERLILEDVGMDGKVILKWILKKYYVRVSSGKKKCSVLVSMVINLRLLA